MAKEISKSQIDWLGERLKLSKTEEELRLLEQYRHSFRAAHGFVYKEIREKLLLEPTKRRTKTTQSIVDKLHRESIRLTQIQDIAGCRIVAKNIADQDKIIKKLGKLFDDIKIKDRREKPSYGYRAVHVIVFIEKKAMEIQVRTELQHLWAELSEKLADIFGQEVKYGAGEELCKNLLNIFSGKVEGLEGIEIRLAIRHRAKPETRMKVIELKKKLKKKLLLQKQELLAEISSAIKEFKKLKRH